jgi:alpha-amylase/alpha-mannosidase (GH57 family)
MAQAYGHLILPLATERDKRTQVRGGMTDFERRFGRPAEGMWLPETAVCTATLRALLDAGIKFTILAPGQCAAVRRGSELKAVPTSDRALDTRRPYRVDVGDGRKIAVFFYDGATSQAVAFERLLANGDTFAHRLLSPFSKDSTTDDELVSIATDGETYGHHHKYGEMALAYALDKIDAGKVATLTNYAAYLASHPPVDDAIILEGSAWSCAHGVGRWSADCGCRMRGDSNQAWRAPLRRALDRLRDRVDAAFERDGAGLFADPWAARDAYIDVILDRERTDAFLGQHLTPEVHAAR